MLLLVLRIKRHTVNPLVNRIFQFQLKHNILCFRIYFCHACTTLLWNGAQRFGLRLSRFDGGNLRNAIAREAHAVIAIPEADKHALRTDLNVFAAQAEAEYAVADPDLQFILESENPRAKAIDKDTAKRLLQALYAAPHGVYAMSQDIPGLVETSTNLASVKMKPGHIIRIETSQRSSTASSKQNIANMVRLSLIHI